MPRQSIWVHGTATVAQFVGGIAITSPGTPGHEMQQVDRQSWTDIVGLPASDGMKFRGQAGKTNTFMIPIPTLVYRDGVRARLARVALKFVAESGVNIIALRIADGARELPFGFPPMSLGGDHSLTWDANVNYFENPAPPDIDTSVCIIVEVRFSQEGNITFCAAGCDVIV
jgi:hypothetical protein